jgi:hypothetical protein
MAELQEQNSGSGGDANPSIAASLAEISSSLFPPYGEDAKEESEGSELPEGEELSAADVAEASADDSAPPQTDEGAEVDTGADPTSAPPKTWSKEAATWWEKVPPQVQAEIHKREQDIFKGIEQYREAANVGRAYQEVLTPYQADIQAAGINPVEMFQNFAANHWILSKGTPEQKLTVVKNLISHYGIDVNALAGEATDQPYVDPEIKALRDKIAELENGVLQQRRQAEQARMAEVTKLVQAFASDPKNIHFPVVEAEMARLIQAGLANTLEEAYEKAVYANPQTRAAETERLKTEAIEAERKRIAALTAKKAATAANVNTTAKPFGATAPVGTLEDTIAQTLANIRQRS